MYLCINVHVALGLPYVHSFKLVWNAYSSPFMYFFFYFNLR